MFNLSLPLLLELFRRILVSALCGALIGLERDIHGRAAGLRTHTLVAIGSALFTINSVLIALLGLLVIFSGKWLELKLHRLYPFQLLVEARSSARLEDVKGFLEQAYKLDIASLNLSVANTETATVYRATFFLDTSISLRQPDACLKLTQELLDRFPDLLTISYKCES